MHELEELKKSNAAFSLTRDSEITAVRKEMNKKHSQALATLRCESEERLVHDIPNVLKNAFLQYTCIHCSRFFL